MDRPAEATSRLWCEIGGQWRYRLVVVAGIVGEFDGDRLGRALRYGAVQLLYRPLGLDALVEPYEADTLRQACRGADVGETHKITLVIARLRRRRRHSTRDATFSRSFFFSFLYFTFFLSSSAASISIDRSAIGFFVLLFRLSPSESEQNRGERKRDSRETKQR